MKMQSRHNNCKPTKNWRHRDCSPSLRAGLESFFIPYPMIIAIKRVYMQQAVVGGGCDCISDPVELICRAQAAVPGTNLLAQWP